MNIQIGEHLIHIPSYSDSLDSFLRRNYCVLSSEPQREPDIILRFQSGYGFPFVEYNLDVERSEHHVVFQRADYRIEADASFQTATISYHDEFALKHALMNLYSAFIVQRGWGVLVHSSCVVEDHKGYLFAGYSGNGKSTTARLSHPRPVLSDEASIIRIRNDGVTVFHSPFRSEIQSSDSISTEGLALDSIHILYQAERNKRAKLSKADGLLQLTDKVFYWNSGMPDEFRRIIALLGRLVDRVPVYELHFQKNPTFWELITPCSTISEAQTVKPSVSMTNG